MSTPTTPAAGALRRPAAIASVTAVVAAVVTAAGAWAASPAAASSTLDCFSYDVVNFSPGITFAKSQLNFDIAEEGSVIHCEGAIRGHEITGPGTYWAKGSIAGDCTAGVGKIDRWSMTFPTEGGDQKVESPGGFTYTGPTGEFRTSAYNGKFHFAPLAGNCVAGGITKSEVLLHGTLTVP